MKSCKWFSLFLVFVFVPNLAEGHLNLDLAPQANPQEKGRADSASCAEVINFVSCFRLLRRSHGITKEGFGFSQNDYRGPDGEKVRFRIVHYDSTERARNEFEAQIRSATKVVDHQKKPFDQDKDYEMAELIVGKGNEPGMVISIVGKDLRSAESDSPQDLAFIMSLMRPPSDPPQ
jgi:hypothetical protein